MSGQVSDQPAVTLAVVGGAGAMGRIAVRDLVETADAEVGILIADYNQRAASDLARAYRGRARSVQVDVTNVAATARALKRADTFAVINCCQHELNLPVMEAALRAGAHYCDLGGLFHVTRRQLELHTRFKRAGLLALLGIGAAPGVVNVLARAAADEMERVDEIHVLVGNVDRTPGRDPGVLGASYSIQTILDEASLPAAIFTDGKFAFVDAMSDPQAVQFPLPVGLRHPARTLHSEVATLPLSYRDKGIREVSFRIAFSDAFAERLRFLHALGMTSTTPIPVGKAKVAPRDLLTALATGYPGRPTAVHPTSTRCCGWWFAERAPAQRSRRCSIATRPASRAGASASMSIPVARPRSQCSCCWRARSPSARRAAPRAGDPGRAVLRRARQARHAHRPPAARCADLDIGLAQRQGAGSAR